MEKKNELKAPKKRKPYEKPSIQSERVLEAGMGTCNATSGGKKITTGAGCTSSKLIC